jgi:WD40 repeat protein
MAQRHLSELPAATIPLADADLLHICQSLTDKKITAEDLAAWILKKSPNAPAVQYVNDADITVSIDPVRDRVIVFEAATTDRTITFPDITADEVSMRVVVIRKGSGVGKLLVSSSYFPSFYLGFDGEVAEILVSLVDGVYEWIVGTKNNFIANVVNSNSILIPNKRYKTRGPLNLTLPSSVVEGDRIEIFAEDPVKVVQPLAQSGISYFDRWFTTKGTAGFLELKGKRKIILQYKGNGFNGVEPGVKVTDPVDLPASGAYGNSWSPNGRYLAVGFDSSPYLIIYDWATGLPVKIADPATLPTNTVYGCSWSPDSRYLAVGHLTSPYVTIYDWITGEPVKITNPATLPTGSGHKGEWSPDSRYLTLPHTTTPFITIYDWITGAPVKITNPATLPTGDGRSCSWTPDGKYLAVGHDVSPYVTIYDWTSGVPLKIANPATLPAGISIACWSPNGKFLGASHVTSPYATIYKYANSSIVKITNPATLPAGNGEECCWSPNGRYFSLSHAGTPYVTIYKMVEDITDAWIVEELCVLSPNEIESVFR